MYGVKISGPSSVAQCGREEGKACCGLQGVDFSFWFWNFCWGFDERPRASAQQLFRTKKVKKSCMTVQISLLTGQIAYGVRGRRAARQTIQFQAFIETLLRGLRVSVRGILSFGSPLSKLKRATPPLDN
jgi:hypothetical protein